jgi:hypothetical protein
MARYILVRLVALKKFCEKYWNCGALKKQIMGGKDGVLKCLLDNWDYFVYNVQAMCVTHRHQHAARTEEWLQPADDQQPLQDPAKFARRAQPVHERQRAGGAQGHMLLGRQSGRRDWCI